MLGIAGKIVAPFVWVAIGFGLGWAWAEYGVPLG